MNICPRLAGLCLVLFLCAPSLAQPRERPPRLRSALAEILPTPNRNSPNISPTHQGWCTDGRFYYTIHTNRIDKRRRDAAWSIVAQNRQPFAGLPQTERLNHLGDCDLDGAGRIYVPVERYSNRLREADQQQIAIYSAADLRLIGRLDLGGAVDGAGGVAVDAANGVLWMVVHSDPDRLFRFRLRDGAALPPTYLPPGFRGPQGIALGPDGLLYVSGRAPGYGKVVAAFSRNGDLRRILQLPIANTIEGLGFDTNGQLGVLDNVSGRNDPSIIRFFNLPPTRP